MKQVKLFFFAICLLGQRKADQLLEKTNISVSRVSRATNSEFSSIINNLSVSARLITAISLQNGLIDQSIPADKVLTELLNIGSVDMEQLEHFDKTKVDGFAKSLSSLALQPTAPGTQVKVEETVLTLDSWARRFEGVGDLADMSEVNKYFVEIGKLKSTVFDVAFLNESTTAIDAVIPSVEGIKDLPTDTRTNQAENLHLTSKLVQMNTHLKVVRSFIDKFSTLSDVLKQFEPLTKSDFPFNSPVCKFLELLENFYITEQQVRSFSPKEGTDLVAAIAQVTSIDSETPRVDTLTLKAAMESRVAANLSFTSGFLEGAADLQKLDSDAQNEWFGSMSKGYSMEKLTSGFVLLKDLGTQLTTLKDSWKTLSTPQQLESVQRVARIVKIHEKIKVAKSVEVESVTKINDIAGRKPTEHSGFTDDAKKVYENAAHLASILNLVIPLVQLLSDSDVMKGLASVGQLTDSSKFPEDVNIQVSALPDVIDKVKAIKDTEALAENLKKLKPLLEDIVRKLGKLDLNAIVKELVNGESAMTAFQSNPITQKFSDFYKSIIDSAGDLESVKTSVQLHREVRNLPSGAVQDVEAVTTAFSNTLSGIKDVRGGIDSIKNGTVELKDLGKDSKTFGDSVKALDNVRKVLEKKDDIEKFLEGSDLVEVEILKVAVPSTQRELLDDWGDFEEVKRAVFELLIDLEAKRDKIQAMRRKRATSGFTNYQSVFTEFQGLPDVNWNTEKLQKVLKTLASSSQNMKDLKASLDSLGSLNLKFASSNQPLAQIATTLANLQKTFSNKGGGGSGGSGGSGGGSGGSKQGGGAGGQGSQGSSGSSGASGALSTTPASSNILYDYWWTILIAVGFVAALCLGVWYFCCKQKKSKDKKENQKSKPTPEPKTIMARSEMKKEEKKKKKKRRTRSTATSLSNEEKEPLINKDKKEKQAKKVDHPEEKEEKSKTRSTGKPFKTKTVDETKQAERNDFVTLPDNSDSDKKKSEKKPTEEPKEPAYYDPMTYVVRQSTWACSRTLAFIEQESFHGKHLAKVWLPTFATANLWRTFYQNICNYFCVKELRETKESDERPRQCRDVKIKCYTDADVKPPLGGDDYFYHANLFNDLNAIVAQAPLYLKHEDKDDTRSAFWHMVYEFRTQCIVHLGAIDEKYLPEKDEPLTFGVLNISLEGDSATHMEGELVSRKIKIVYVMNRVCYAQDASQPSLELAHVHVPKCNENQIPTGKTRDAVKFACAATLRQNKKTVVVSETGTNLAMSFVGADYILQNGPGDSRKTIPELIGALARFRCAPFSSGAHILFAFSLALELFSDRNLPNQPEQAKELKAQVKWHKDICDNYRNMKGDLHKRVEVQLADELERLLGAEKKTEATTEAGGKNEDKLEFIAKCAPHKKRFADEEEQEKLKKAAEEGAKKAAEKAARDERIAKNEAEHKLRNLTESEAH